MQDAGGSRDGAEVEPTVIGGASDDDEETGLQSGVRKAHAARGEPEAARARYLSAAGGDGRMSIGRLRLFLVLVAVGVPCFLVGRFLGPPARAAAPPSTPPPSAVRSADVPARVSAGAGTGSASRSPAAATSSGDRAGTGSHSSIPAAIRAAIKPPPSTDDHRPRKPPRSIRPPPSTDDHRPSRPPPSSAAHRHIKPPPSAAAHDVEWDKRAQLGSDGPNACQFRVAADRSTQLCIRPYHDLVSDVVRNTGGWGECNELAAIWRRQLSEGDAFFDIGANIGICTASLAASGMAREVFAFEPSEKNLFYLTGTFLRNPSHLGRLRLFPVGLGDATTDLPIFAEPANAGHSVIGAAVGELGRAVPKRIGTIPVRRLDDLIRPPYPKIRLAKIDVEGFETKVLRGGRQLFTSGAVRSVYFELSPFLSGQGSSRLELINLFLEFGFEFREVYGSTMHRSRLQGFACDECPHCFANLFAIMAHHSPTTAQKLLHRCR